MVLVSAAVSRQHIISGLITSVMPRTVNGTGQTPHVPNPHVSNNYNKKNAGLASSRGPSCL